MKKGTTWMSLIILRTALIEHENEFNKIERCFSKRIQATEHLKFYDQILYIYIRNTCSWYAIDISLGNWTTESPKVQLSSFSKRQWCQADWAKSGQTFNVIPFDAAGIIGLFTINV